MDNIDNFDKNGQYRRKMLPSENGVSHKHSLSMDNVDAEVSVPCAVKCTEDVSDQLFEKNESPIAPLASVGSPTALASMQLQNTDVNDCNVSLNSTLTESSQFEICREDEPSSSQQLQSTSSQESLHSQNLCTTLHDDIESATESTNLHSSAHNSPKNSRTTSSVPEKPAVGAVGGDSSSFSSISSLSTSTDVSVTATTTTSSSEVETGEASTVVAQATLPVDEQGFVEINLDARNSFEPSRVVASSQDSGQVGVDGKTQSPPAGSTSAGAKPKRATGFTSFLSR